MNNPSFSIITITYNAEKFIERTIRSIIEQTYPFVEHIIIDGKSSDNTLQLIDKYVDKIACIVSEPDAGLYDAMNKGLQRATGDYVWFINAGDSLYKRDTVEQLVKSLNDRLPDIIYGDTAIVDENGNFLHLRRLRPPKKLSWKSFRMGMTVCHQSFIVKRSGASEYDLAYQFSSDFDWCIRCMKRAKVIYNSGIILSNYMEGGLTLKHHKASLKERYQIMSGYYGKITTFFMHGWFAVRFYFMKLFSSKRM